MKRTLFAITTSLLMLVGLAAAQGYEYPAYAGYEYGVFGDVGYGDYYELDAYDEAAVGYPYGSIRLTTEGTTGQALDVVITGPDGYTRTFESQSGAQTEVVELPVGVHSIAATDDGLQMGHALVEVRNGSGQDVTLSLNAYEQAQGEVGEGYSLEAGYYGVEEEFGEGYEPFGSVRVDGYEAYENQESGAIVVQVEGIGDDGEAVAYGDLGAVVTGHVVGPNDQRTEFEGASTNTQDLAPGRYSIAATAPGYRVVQSFVQVQAGQTITMTLQMKQMSGQDGQSGQADQDQQAGMSGAAAAGGVAAGLYESWNADGNDSLTAEEYEAGLFDTLAGDDGELSEDEFSQGLSRLHGEDAQNQYAFSDFDGDGNGAVTEEEFTSTYEPAMFSEWNQDGSAGLTSNEFESGWFGVVDQNGDGTVDQDEYGPFAGWFGTDYGELGAGNEGIGEEGWLGN